MERKIVASNDTIVAPASGAGRAAIAVIRLSGAARRASVLEALCGGVPPARHASLARHRPATRRADRPRPGAVVPGAFELHRRGHGRAARPWQPRRDPRGDRRGARARRHAARRARRVRAPRVRERQARSHRGRGPRRSRRRPRPRRSAVRRSRQSQGSLRALYDGVARRAAARAGADRGRTRFRRRGRRDRRCRRSRPTTIVAGLARRDRASSRRAAAARGCATDCAW